MRKLTEALVDELIGYVRTDPVGVKSLAHLLVVVPTAQSGRRLRLALAKRLGSFLPPEIRLPSNMWSVEEPALAVRTDELAAFYAALEGDAKTLEVARSLADLRNLLGAKALTFAEVAEKIPTLLKGDLAEVEAERWRKLAELEKRYYVALSQVGRKDRISLVREAIAKPELPAGIETIFLAEVNEPIPVFGEFLKRLKEKQPALSIVDWHFIFKEKELSRASIRQCATAASEAEMIAERYASINPEEALPALCLADPELYPEISGALKARGFKVYNPSATLVKTSSLGRLVEQLAALVRTRSYNVFSAFVRSGDVRRWLKKELGYQDKEIVEALIDLDNRQAQLLPETIDDIAPKTKGKLRNIFEFILVKLRKQGLRGLLRSIFADRALDERSGEDREFAAAAETINRLIDECFIYPELGWDLFAQRLDEVTYSLEPDEGEVVITDGWLEIPYLEAEELIIAGFREGAVPESIVGHAFLPDTLRKELGLIDNERRYLRDRRILTLAVSTREVNAMQVSFHTVDAEGDVLKPSRLLFETGNDREFIERVEDFYSHSVGTYLSPARTLPSAWKLALPIPPERKVLEHASPSSIDTYLRCPFTYYLKKLFGERQDDRAEELDPSEFGNLAHNALEDWAKGSARDSENADEIAAELGASVDRILGERFGTNIPMIVALQGESVKRRLKAFARIQVEWHKAGWSIVEAERKLEVKLDNVRLHGRCDRIDYNRELGRWCVIDYKTWDSAAKAGDSLQLPLYCSMLDADLGYPDAKRDRISAAYCILGKTAEDTVYSKLAEGEMVVEAENKVKEIVDKIERGIFWPPAPTKEWRYDFSEWLADDPETSVNEVWISDQQRRIS